MLGIVQSAGDLLASTVVGLLYALVSPTVAFGYTAAWMVLSLIVAAMTRPQL